MHPILFYGLMLLLTPFYLLALFIFIFLAPETVTRVLQKFSFFFTPLRIVLLTPGAVKSHLKSKTHWFSRRKKNNKVVLILGGNGMTVNEAYDCVYSRLVDDNLTDIDCACIPLLTHFTQEQYIQYLVDTCESDILIGKEHLYVYGHSLGGALSIHLVDALSKKSPDLKMDLFVSRTFNKLWSVSRCKYGNILGGYFEKVFSGLWTLESQQVLSNMKRENLSIIIEETLPDEIIGTACLQATGLSNEKFYSYVVKDNSSFYPDMLHCLSQAHLKSLKEQGILVLQ